MSNIRISDLKNTLDSILGINSWFDYEPETIIMEMDDRGLDISGNNLADLIFVLKILGIRPNIFYEDFWFTLISTDVINGNEANFNSVPHINSLELALAIVEVQKVLSTLGVGVLSSYSDDFIDAVSSILISEGYSKPVGPFIFIPESKLESGQTDEDTAHKIRAIKMYIKGFHNYD